MALLPSPRTSDTNGAGHHGDGGMDLRTAVAEIPLLPTPVAKEPGGTAEQYHARLMAHDGRESTFLPLSMAVQLLPTPTRRDHKDSEVRREPHRPDDVDTLSRALADVLLPTPRATDGTKGERGEELLLKGVARAAAEGALLPTPTAQDSAQSGGGYNGQTNVTLTDATVRQPARWGEYEPAIRRWESLTRPAPEPTKPGAKGNPKLSDEFDEWLMGYPAGWITDVPGVTWNETLKACGNGVVRQQGAAALRHLLAMGAAA